MSVSELDRQPCSELWRRDVREFGVEVKLLAATRVFAMEPLSWKAPSIARPYCCYINTVIFYVWPYEIVKPRSGPWKDSSPGSFREWDRVNSLLGWDTVFNVDGREYVSQGGRVIRYRKGWWMARQARLRNGLHKINELHLA